MATIKHDWQMPNYVQVTCPDCGEVVRPIAVDVGSFEHESELSISCPEGCTLTADVEWPFVEKEATVDELTAIGFECID